MRGGVLLACALLAAAPVTVQPRGAAARISLLEGTAHVRRGSAIPQELREGSLARQGQELETDDDSKVELDLAGASKVRLGPRTRLLLSAIEPAAGGKQPLAVRLSSGNLWVTAAKGERTLEVQTEDAVATARGAAFRIDAHADRSVLVRVYSGALTVRRNPSAAARSDDPIRRRPPEPWEKVVRNDMQMLVSADGTPGLPAPFTAADEKDDDWARWNRKRDEQRK